MKSFLAFIVFVSLLAPVMAEPFGASLMHPHSFDGWNHGPKPITGWTVKDGQFSGTSGGVELLSGFSADCSEVRMKWTVAEEGKLLVRMPEAPTGKGLTLTLCEGEGSGRLLDGETELSPGVKIDPKKEGTPHTLTVRRANGKINVTIDGRSLYDLTLDTSRRFGLALVVEKGKATVADIRGTEPLGEQIFNGKDLTGWRDDTPGAWKVENGELVLKPHSGLKWIRSIKDYENFTISFEYKLQKRGNSGLAIRTPRIGWPSNDGFEMQLIDRLDPKQLVKDSLLSSYCNIPPICRADTPGNEAWKQVVVKTDGWMLSAWLNGHLVQQFNTQFHPEDRYRQLRGWVGFQDHGKWIRVRNIRLREAPNGEGLQAWYTHPEPNGAALLVDRLMNSELLATDQKVRSAVVSMNVDAATPGEYVLADLKGPGVVTNLTLLEAAKNTKLFFYVDGDPKARIVCRQRDLYKALPKINRLGSPLAAILCYEKSLKIVARNCRRVESRIEYATMPKEHPIRSFVSHDDTGIPRGWAAPPVFRSARIAKGTFHAHDPSHIIRNPEKRLRPGVTKQLIHVDGAGTVKYLKLLGDRSILKSNDLWIEVTYDRESTPAISAPARFWLPALVKQGGFYNFLFRDLYGLTSHLGIPFSDGMTISLVNRGKRSIMKVGLEVSIIADDSNLYGQPIGPMRLRGKYLPAGQKSDVLFEHKGKGRLIGLVVDAPKGATPGIARLEVDSRRVPGWSSSDMAPLLGSKNTNFANMTSGNRDGIAWRYLLLAPIDFQNSIKMQSTTTIKAKTLPGRLILYYTYCE